MSEPFEIKWEDPPVDALGAGQTVGRLLPFARALRDNPSAWALLPVESKNRDSLKQTALTIRRGARKGFEDDGKGKFEAVVDGTALKCWVRYVLPEESGGYATPLDDPEAPYGRRADGTPKAKPGRKNGNDEGGGEE